MNQQRYVQNKRTGKQNYFSLSIAILLGGIAMLLFSCENKIEQIKQVSSAEELPSMKADGFEMIYSDSAIVRFKVKAPELIHHDEVKEPFTEFPKGMEIEKYDANMQIVSRITADYARYYDEKNKQRWIAKNNVVVVNQKGDSLKTEELTWDQKNAKFYSDQSVQIISADRIINGIGFESDQSMNDWEIKQVTGTIDITDKKKEQEQ